MKLPLLLCILGFFGLVIAWTKEDYEIFDLVSALEGSEGKGTTFYSLLDVEPSATLSQLNKAYRKKSLQMHPDKNPGVKNIHDRFARLGVVAAILRSPESRERYNFFYKNGVPKWRGTGYYYSRFRPTLGHTIAFLVLLSSLAHLLVMRLNYNKDRRRVAYFESSARALAGAPRESKTGAGAAVKRRRKVRVPMVQGQSGEGSGAVELIVQDDQVYLAGDDGVDVPLSSLATPPSVYRTWPVQLALSLIRRATALLPPSVQAKLPAHLLSTHAHGDGVEYDDDDESDDVDSEVPSASGAGTPTPTPGPRRGKISDLKRQERLQGKGGKGRGGAASNGTSGATTPMTADSAASTELESGSGDEEAEAPGAGEGEGKKKKKGLGKAGAARRRKMGIKK